MVTQFGKLLRLYRLENGYILKDMADALKVPSSYLSAMEMGRKAVSNEFLNKILATYPFTEEETENLKQAAELSATSVRFNLEKANAEKRSMALNFARQFESMDDETVEKIKALLK